jgi:hypothetical protein
MDNSGKWEVYGHAQKAAYHTDKIMWDVTGILFGANTLLFGFILTAAEGRRAVPLLVASVLGVGLTGFTAHVCNTARVAKDVGYGICRRIEAGFPEADHGLRLHTMIDERYPKGMARNWVYGLCIAFFLVWVGVFLFGWRLAVLATTGGNGHLF